MEKKRKISDYLIPKNEESKSLKAELEIKSNRREVLQQGFEKIGPLQRNLISAMVAMTKDDDLFTYSEYEKLFITIDLIIDLFSLKPKNDLSDPELEKHLYYNYTYREILSNKQWQDEIRDLGSFIVKVFSSFNKESDDKELAKENKNHFEDLLANIFEIIIPLVKVQQQDKNNKINKWKEVLGASSSELTEFNKKKSVDIDDDENDSFLNKLKKPFMSLSNRNKNNKDIEEYAIELCESFDLEEYKNSLTNKKSNSKARKKTLINIKTEMINIVHKKIPSAETMHGMIEFSNKYVNIINSFGNQVKKRLEIIEPRLEFQLEMFDDDFVQFKESSISALYKALHGSSNIKLDDIKYGPTSKLIKYKFQSLQYRHKKFIDLWKREIQAFEIEMEELTKQIINDFFRERSNERDISDLLDNSFKSYAFKKKIDNIAKNISGATNAAMALGTISVFIIGPALLNPVTAAIAGVVGIAALSSKLWLRYTDPEIRKIKEIDKVVKDVGERFETIYPNPKDEYFLVLKSISNSFIDSARKFYEPLMLKVILLSNEIEMKQKVFAKIIEDTEKDMDNCISKYK